MELFLAIIVFLAFLMGSEEAPSQRRDRAARRRKNKRYYRWYD
jgi:hypothetical protein